MTTVVPASMCSQCMEEPTRVQARFTHADAPSLFGFDPTHAVRSFDRRIWVVDLCTGCHAALLEKCGEKAAALREGRLDTGDTQDSPQVLV